MDASGIIGVQAMKRLMHQTELQAEDFARLGVSLPGIVDNEREFCFTHLMQTGKMWKSRGYLSKKTWDFNGVRCEE